MKTLEVRVPYHTSREEMKRRMDEALVKARGEYADAVGPIEASWHGECLKVHLAAMGMKFDGQVEVADKELVVTLELPGMASLFAGRIREGIEQRLGGLIGAATA